MNQPKTEKPAGGVQAAYHAFLASGRFMIQRCYDCSRHVFYPREVCPHCGGIRLEWVQPSGEGTVYAVTTVRRKADAGGAYNVSLIDLDEGVRMMSRVEGLAIDDVTIGQRVRARVVMSDGRGVVVFDPLESKGLST
jgi:uncharacterized OB-fold protein